VELAIDPTGKNRAEYERRLHKVLAYIDRHLDEPIDLARLAKEANFSDYHFHRIFTALTGETLGSYLTRRRVEMAAIRLWSQPRLSVLNVALAVGFGSAEAFSRAFKKRLGTSPSQWRTRKSKLSQDNSNPGQELSAPRAYLQSMENTQVLPLQVTVAKRPSVRFAYLRYQGPVGPAIGAFWQQRVYPWLAANNLLGAPRYGVSQDDPNVTEERRCRYDGGAEVGLDFVPPQDAQVTEVPGGLYASTKFLGTSEEVSQTWERILREWLPASGYQLDARPFFEYYPVDATYDPKTGAFSCEICIPIARL
jgi:AraC family transcriptional regulator